MPASEAQDRPVLMAVFRVCGGAAWKNSEGWGTDEPLGQWYGVKTENGRVVSLELAENNLSGEYKLIR